MGNQQKTQPHGIKNPRLKITVLVVIILFFGALFTWWTAVRADREMRADLLVQARLVAKAVNIARIQTLSGTIADLKSPDYQRLKEQLTDVRSANPQCRSFYLIGRKADGVVFFFVNSEPEGSKSYSSPGQVYKDAPASYRRVFDTKAEDVIGPVTDHQGTWISTLIPINDTITGSSDLVTENEAQAIVRKAVDFYRKNGRESLLKEINNPQGKFRKGELHSFVYNLEMTMKAHPVKPELVGQNLLNKKDWAGDKYFSKEIQKVALSRGSGWVDYQYENPVNKKILPKTTYVQKVDDLIVCAGAYKSTGEMLAMLGMDIDAGAWKWNVAARSALPVGVILMLLIGVLTIFATTRTAYHDSTNERIDTSTKPGLRRLLLPLAIPSLLALAVMIGGWWFYSEQKQAIRKGIEEQLTSILRSKVNQITDWREKQIKEAILLSKSPFFVRETTGLLANPKAEGTRKLLDFLRLSQSDYDYKDIILVDPKGQERLHLTENLERFHLDDKVALTTALREHKPVFIDLHISEEKTKVNLGIVVPLLADNEQVKTPIGAVIMIIDASKFLYPLIQSWPVLSKTAETLLVRRDGDNVLFLNELRHQHGTALKLRIPLTKTDVPAVMAVLGLKSSMEQSKDYRGVDVVSVFQPIPDSPWFMVAKVDAAEVFANWQLRAGTILTLIISLIILTGALWFILWQRSEKALYGALRQSRESMQKNEQLLSATLRSIGDGVITCDTEGNIINLNSAAEKLTGWSTDEAKGLPVVEVFHTIHNETRQEAEDLVGRTLRENRVLGMAIHTALIARYGREYQIADSCAPIHDAAGGIIGAVLVFRDTSEEYHRREQMERRHNLSYELMDILNSPAVLPDMINAVVLLIKRWTSFDAVGIRLQAGDDFPYFAQIGFSDDFLLTENTLVEHGKDSGLCRDKDGNVSLQCTCGLIISGKTDPANTLFTPGGSFWTNNSFSLLELPSGEDPRLHPRNRCMHEGYGSLALIPIFENQKIVGLLQLNNRKTDSLSLDTINFFELISANIGEALMRNKAEWALKERFKELNCLYGISALIELPDISLEELLKKTTYLLPPAWQFSEITEARIVLEENIIQTARFRETPWILTQKIIVNGKPAGKVEVCYLEERPTSDEGPFLIEERQLIKAVAERLGRVIERNRAESELRESDERYKALFDCSLDFVYLCDFEGRFIDANAAALNRLGYTREDIHSVNFASLLSEDQLPLALKTVQEIQKTGIQKDPAEFRLRHKNGSEVCVETLGSTLMSNGRPVAIQAIARDITERKKQEDIILLLNEQQQIILDSSPTMIFYKDKDNRFIRVNEALARANGMSKEEMEGKTMWEIYSKEAADNYWQDDKEVMAAGKPLLNVIEEMKTPKGIMWVQTDKIPYRNSKGEIIGILGFTSDITERKCAEEKLAHLSIQNELVLNSAAEGILGLDLQGNHTFVNSAAARMLGYETEELIGRPGHSTWHHTKPDGSPYPKKECAILTAYLEGDVHRVSTEVFWRKDGTSFPVEYASTPIYEQGRTAGVVVTFADITERKKTEEQIQHLATHDLLTDLPSLGLAKDRLSSAINMARRYKKAVALMFVDLDGFKAVNDTLGHEAGDHVLKQVVQRLLSCVRETDTVARIGGDEFLIIATEINTPENAAQIAEKVIRTVSQPVIFNEQQAVVGASIGIALFPDHGEDMDQLIKQADEAMYSVKNAGKQGFRFVNNAIKNAFKKR